MLLTFLPGIEAEGFELNKGFQLKGLLKGTVVASLVEAEARSPGAYTKGVDTEEIRIPLTDVVTKLLGPGILWLLGFPISYVELTIGGEDGGGTELATNGTDPMVAGFEMDVGATKDMANTGAK